VKSVTRVYNYYKKFGYKTVVMGASFRNIGEITELAGCDLLTISPQLLAELEATTRARCRASSTPKPQGDGIERIPMDKDVFEAMHAADRMATDKLKEGIEGFSAALVKLEGMLATGWPSSKPTQAQRSRCGAEITIMGQPSGGALFAVVFRDSRSAFGPSSAGPPSQSNSHSANKLGSPLL
jgi:hypothetical protein